MNGNIILQEIALIIDATVEELIEYANESVGLPKGESE